MALITHKVYTIYIYIYIYSERAVCDGSRTSVRVARAAGGEDARDGGGDLCREAEAWQGRSRSVPECLRKVQRILLARWVLGMVHVYVQVGWAILSWLWAAEQLTLSASTIAHSSTVELSLHSKGLHSVVHGVWKTMSLTIVQLSLVTTSRSVGATHL